MGLVGLFRLFRLTGYIAPFGTPSTRLACTPKLGLAPLPNPLRVGHTTIIVGSVHRDGALADTSSVSRAFLERSFERFWPFLAIFGHVSSDFSAAALYSAHPSPPFVVHMILVR